MSGAPKSPDPAIFSPSRFLADCKRLASAINAPCSETILHKILETYHQCFLDFPVGWRTTDRPSDALNIRFYTPGFHGRKLRNITAISVAGGFLKEDNVLSSIFASWSALYDDATEMCDFDAEKGLVKTWLSLDGYRPLDDILQARDVPEPVRRHAPALKRLGLNDVRYVCVNYESETVNIYGKLQATVSGFQDRIAELVALAGSPPPSDDDILEMRKWTNPEENLSAVTIHVVTGAIQRVAVYAMDLPEGGIPKVGERLMQFFEHAPSYDDIEFNIVGWSFGKGRNRYMKVERGYTGQLLRVMQSRTPI